MRSLINFLQWDKGDTNMYYAMSGQLLYPVYNSVLESVTVNKVLSNEIIDLVYCKTVEALLTASNCYITVLPQNILKFWWNLISLF